MEDRHTVRPCCRLGRSDLPAPAVHSDAQIIAEYENREAVSTAWLNRSQLAAAAVARDPAIGTRL